MSSSEAEQGSASASDAEDSNSVTNARQIQLKAAINSLSGMHAVQVSKSALYAADREANAGLTAKARKVVASMKRKPKLHKSSREKASSSASQQGSSTVFEVRAVVLYTQGCISMDEESGRYIFDEPIRPLTNDGLLHELEQEGQVKFNVAFDRAWSSARVHRALQNALPGFFEYLKGQGDHADGRGAYVLCYPESRKLCVHTSAEPTGEQLYGVKSRKGRGKSESFIHIASIEPVPADVLRRTSWLPSKPLHSLSDGEDNSGNILSNQTTRKSLKSLSGASPPFANASKGKKRAMEADSDQESEVEIVEGPLKAPRLANGGKGNSLLGRLDRALAKLPAIAKVKTEPIEMTRPKPIAIKRKDTKSQTPPKPNKTSNGPTYRFKNAPVFSRTPSPTPSPTMPTSFEPLFPVNSAFGFGDTTDTSRPTSFVTQPSFSEASTSGIRHGSPSLPLSQPPPPPIAGPSTPSTHAALATWSSNMPLHHSPGRWERPSDMSDPWAN
ncbi:hypothetical protein BC835DRAFT_1360501 [Cytidiella melzeri]|nr:hypothetical protein BC835DRAFT_1360501 [Cytidiella melzeri]